MNATNSIRRIREEWLRGSPPDKVGVTRRYVEFGEARAWIVEQLGLGKDDSVLDLGSGHGFLSFEVASRTRARVVGLDSLGGEQSKIAKGGARLGELEDRIDWIIGDGRTMPFSDEIFDAAVSFLALQDVYMTSGEAAVLEVIEDSCRIIKPEGVLAIADNLFPESTQNESQRLYSRIHSDEFHARLPPLNMVKRQIEECGLTSLKEHRYNPHIDLDEKESRIELQDIVDARPFGRIFNFEKIWAKYKHDIGRVGLSYPDLLLIEGRRS